MPNDSFGRRMNGRKPLRALPGYGRNGALPLFFASKTEAKA